MGKCPSEGAGGCLKKRDLIAVGNMQTTIWETAWYLRGMENLFCDMMAEEDTAEFLLDKVLEISMIRARSYAEAGVDVIYFGDDIGMQQTIMMSEELYWQVAEAKAHPACGHGEGH